MNLLLIDTHDEVLSDVQELVREQHAMLYTAHSREEALRILSDRPIHKALFALRTVADLEFLSYLNKRYSAIEVILTLGEPLHDIVKILREGQFDILKNPLDFSELRNIIDAAR